MTFSVSELIVDSDQNVTALLWRYTNSDGSLGGTWTLEKPYGSTPLANVTEAKSVDWLKEQLPNTTEQFDEQLAASKAEAAYEETLIPYRPNPSGPPTPMPVPVEEIEVVAASKSTKKKT
jgi:hypothetical protein